MGLMEQFELPLPIVKCSVEKITVETQDKYEGFLLLQNTGGGELSGTITSKSKAIVFHPEKFSGNKIKINYSVDISNYNIGDILHTSALIMSNGGELIIPAILKMTPPAIVTAENEKLSSLKEFLWYAKTYPEKARMLFYRPEFSAWLSNMDYEHMELYNHFISDPVKERAVDNFLIFNKMKKKAVLSATQKSITVEIPSYTKEISTGVIPLKLTGWGYIAAGIFPEPNLSWFSLAKTKITSADFDGDGNCGLDFFINPTKLFHRQESIKIKIVPEGGEESREEIREGIREDSIEVGSQITVTLTSSVKPPYSAKLSKTSFSYDDSGYVIIENYKGGDMTVDLQSDCPHIRFEGRQYFIKDHAQIPFTVKVGAIASAQSFLSKQSVINATIFVSVDRRLFVLGMGAKMLDELRLVIAKPIE